MKKQAKWIVILVASIAVLVTAVGVMAYSTNARARESTVLALTGIFPHMGGPGFPGEGPGGDQYLADALGISLDILQSAEQTASDAAIQQAVEQRLITQEQADAMTLRGFPFGGRFGGHWKLGPNEGLKDGIDYNALLADALGTSVEKLQAARDKAQDARLAAAVANGTLTQEQADLIKAQKELKSYLDPQALFAEALGISTDQLQAYREQDLSLSEILAKVGKTAAEVREAQQAAYQAALSKAVSDGVITQEQADQLQAGGFRGLGGFGRGFGRDGGRGGGHGGDLGRFGDFGGWKEAPGAPAPTDQGSG
jgi:hypothetical protein